MKKDIISVIEITDRHVKLVQSQGVNVTSFSVKSIQQGNEEDMARALAEVLPAKSLQKNEIILAVPRRLVILKQLRLPSQSINELRKMIGLQLVNKVPYALTDINYDYIILDKDSSGYTQVLVFIIHKEVGDHFLKLFNRARIPMTKLTVSSMGILGWLNFQERKKVFNSETPVAIIHIDSHHSEICFCHQNNLRFSRQVNYGAVEFKENVNVLLEQIKLSLRTYKIEGMGESLSKIILVSAQPEVIEFKSLVEKEFKGTVDFINPLENIFSKKGKSDLSVKGHPGVSLAVGCGLLIGGNKGFVNLTPEKVRESKVIKVKKRERVTFALLVLLVIILTGFILGAENFEKTAQLKKIQSEIDSLKPMIDKAQRKMEVVSVFDEKLKGRVNVTDLIFQLINAAPEDIALRSLDFSAKGLITIKGYSVTSTGVSSLQSDLIKSSMFEDVSREFATQRKIFNMEVTDFELKAQIATVR